MSEVVSRSPVPRGLRKACLAPGEVLFKRCVTLAGVTAPGSETASSNGPAQSSVRASVSKRTPVRSVLVALSSKRSRVGGVASAFGNEPPLSAPVASQSPCVAYQTARFGSPASMIPLVLRSLKRRAAAAKVSRRLRRLGEANGDVRALRVSSVELRQSGSVASSGRLLRPKWPVSASMSASEFEFVSPAFPVRPVHLQ